MSSQGWFESDDDFQKRMAEEANERIIEESTGNSPSRGLFESNEEYRERIAEEANERLIEDSTGSAPSRGLFESNEEYRTRIEEEANERTIEDSTGAPPSRGWFESQSDYSTRIREEANIERIKDETGEEPTRGWFEGEHDFRKRVAHEAREARVNRDPSESTPTDNSNIPSTSSSKYTSVSTDNTRRLSSNTTGLDSFWVYGIAVVGVLLWLALPWKPYQVRNYPIPTPPPSPQVKPEGHRPQTSPVLHPDSKALPDSFIGSWIMGKTCVEIWSGANQSEYDFYAANCDTETVKPKILKYSVGTLFAVGEETRLEFLPNGKIRGTFRLAPPDEDKLFQNIILERNKAFYGVTQPSEDFLADDTTE